MKTLNLKPIAIASLVASFTSCNPAHAAEYCYAENDGGGRIVLELTPDRKGYSYISKGNAFIFEWAFNEQLGQVLAIYPDKSVMVYPVSAFTCPDSKPKKSKPNT